MKCAWQRQPTTRPITFHVWKTRGCQCSFRLLMMGGVSPETCWASYKYGIIKFLYIVASCWIFLYELKAVSEGDTIHRYRLAVDRKVAMMEQCYVCTVMYCWTVRRLLLCKRQVWRVLCYTGDGYEVYLSLSKLENHFRRSGKKKDANSVHCTFGDARAASTEHISPSVCTRVLLRTRSALRVPQWLNVSTELIICGDQERDIHYVYVWLPWLRVFHAFSSVLRQMPG